MRTGSNTGVLLDTCDTSLGCSRKNSQPSTTNMIKYLAKEEIVLSANRNRKHKSVCSCRSRIVRALSWPVAFVVTDATVLVVYQTLYEVNCYSQSSQMHLQKQSILHPLYSIFRRLKVYPAKELYASEQGILQRSHLKSLP